MLYNPVQLSEGGILQLRDQFYKQIAKGQVYQSLPGRVADKPLLHALAEHRC